jgi:hypothetical protein
MADFVQLTCGGQPCACSSLKTIRNLNRQLTTALTDAGYVVDRAFDGEEGHFLGDSEPYLPPAP